MVLFFYLTEKQNVLVESGVLTSVEQVEAISPVVPYFYRHEAVYKAETTDGLNVVIAKIANKPGEQPVSSDWVKSFDKRRAQDLKDQLYLRGLLEQRKRKFVDAAGNSFVISVLLGPSRFNQAMESLGKHPGLDCFKLVEEKGENFDAQTYVEHIARMEIPITSDNEKLFEHDRDLDDHIPVWWAMSPEIANRLQQNAQEILDEGDESKLKEFTRGVDSFALWSEEAIIPVFSAVDDTWGEGETVADRVAIVTNAIDSFLGAVEGFRWQDGARKQEGDYLGLHVVKSLIETGLITGLDPELVKKALDKKSIGHKISEPEYANVSKIFKETVGAVLTEYVNSVAGLISNLDSITEVPSNVDAEQRKALLQELQNMDYISEAEQSLAA